MLTAQRFELKALALAETRGIRCVVIDVEELRGEREPELALFDA